MIAHPPATLATAAPAPACTANDLLARLVPRHGAPYVALRIRIVNRRATRCTVGGIAKIEFIDAAGLVLRGDDALSMGVVATHVSAFIIVRPGETATVDVATSEPTSTAACVHPA